jgi:hypothetical protein
MSEVKSKEQVMRELLADWNDGHMDAEYLLMIAYESGYYAGALATANRMTQPIVIEKGALKL